MGGPIIHFGLLFAIHSLCNCCSLLDTILLFYKEDLHIKVLESEQKNLTVDKNSCLPDTSRHLGKYIY